MAYLLGEKVEDVMCNTTKGVTGLYDYIGDSWCCLFSHPGDYTPVGTTELGEMARLAPQFDSRGTKVIALSCDHLANHQGWIQDVKAATGFDVNFPIIADPGRDTAAQLKMIKMEHRGADTRGLPRTVRAVLIIGPDKKVKASMQYPLSVGVNFFEILRLLDALQVSSAESVHTPVNWVKSQDVIVSPDMPTDAALEKPTFQQGLRIIDLPSRKEYLRITPDPTTAADEEEEAAAEA
uniref:Thioredoxin domain-containing protein n=1 Tax=Florenciella parvula TaxID=236787 RepID=A0A7S2AXE1_9STRA|mmetsp:Transcript_89186/g.254623  ORF Transcript_89186/g.254623 Transcript_89186/m.254623 type:complete len:237 (-) Transcript_89186:137-847(-)|eukprot:CAMPEP_0119522786 /NCGR_PEP_ID=MMETSP1344-20130328/37988_1 /TAXON_ID=236787 /ORGANISM="Florenciella parvula, Strain CCMP2471" /LENGTH=236 /DNA_ID=CAMNT_0007560845 /DNA_START=46 /DNA_END=756 /DNA_ORIENTATION=-